MKPSNDVIMATKPSGPEAIVAALRRAIDVANDDPAAAEALLRRTPPDSATDGLRLRALGLIAYARGDVDAAIGHLTAAVTAANRHGQSRQAAEAHMSLAAARYLAGDSAAALRALDRAAARLDGVAGGRVAAQRGMVLAFMGRFDEAAACYQAALVPLQRHDDRLWLYRVRCNRGVLRAWQGHLAAAQEDFRTAERLATDLGQPGAVADARHGLGWLASLRSDVPTALAEYDAAERILDDAGLYAARMRTNRAEVLLAAGLGGEARREAAVAVAVQERRRMAADLAETRLVAAQAALADGDDSAAMVAANLAAKAFARQRRASWAAVADHTALLAESRRGPPTRTLLRRAQRTVMALEAAGWTARAIEARVLAGRVALQLGDRDAARQVLRRVNPSRVVTADARARAWHATALLRLADGDRRGASRALDAGLRTVERFQASIGATDLRVGAGGHAVALASEGLRLALRDGAPSRILDWSERWRAGALRLRPVRPPGDTALERDLARLRRVVTEIEEAVTGGRDATAGRREQARLEEATRQRARHAAGTWAPTPRLDISALHDALGERALVSFVVLDGQRLAVVAAGGRTTCTPLPAAGLDAEFDSLAFAVRRLARGQGSPRTLAAAGAAVEAASAALDAALLGPLRQRLQDRPVVVVPTGVLHALPWPLLPTLAGRATTIAPSATLWLRATTTPSTPARAPAVFVAGSRLAHAAPEVVALARGYPGARRATGRTATAARVLALLDGAGVAHIAAHGRFRADNPLFSSLELADGPLMVYDLERLERAPGLLVLSACDSGLSAVRPGDELEGLAAALLALGTRTLIASVAPVPDDRTRTLMLAFHRRVRAGASPAAALAATQAEVASEGPAARAAAASFACFGAGFSAGFSAVDDHPAPAGRSGRIAAG